jgi:hypothetical protein
MPQTFDVKKTFAITVESSLVRSLIGQRMERKLPISLRSRPPIPRKAGA